MIINKFVIIIETKCNKYSAIRRRYECGRCSSAVMLLYRTTISNVINWINYYFLSIYSIKFNNVKRDPTLHTILHTRCLIPIMISEFRYQLHQFNAPLIHYLQFVLASEEWMVLIIPTFIVDKNNQINTLLGMHKALKKCKAFHSIQYYIYPSSVHFLVQFNIKFLLVFLSFKWRKGW